MTEYEVILATANREEAEALRWALEEEGRFRVADAVDSGLACVRAVLAHRPQLVILDLSLKELNGLEVLDRLGSLMPQLPAVMVLTAAPRAVCKQAIALGARLCLRRPCSIEAITTRALDLMLPPLARFTDHDIEAAVWHICTVLGAPVQMKGYRCLKVGVRLVIRNRKLLDRITDRLYPAIKEESGLTGNVEKNLRDFVKALFRDGNIDAIERCFGAVPSLEQAKLTNAAFLVAMAELVTQFLLKADDRKGERSLQVIR